MKMENELRAGRAGVVREVLVAEGASVEAGTPLRGDRMTEQTHPRHRRSNRRRTRPPRPSRARAGPPGAVLGRGRPADRWRSPPSCSRWPSSRRSPSTSGRRCAAWPKRAARQLPEARLHDRPAVHPSAHRPLRRRGPAHRRTREGPIGRSWSRRRSKSRCRSRRSLHREVLVDSVVMTDWQMAGGDVAERTPQFPEVHARQRAAARPEALHDDRGVRAGAARRVHLRGSRRAVEHRRAQPRGRPSRRAAGYGGTAKFTERHRRPSSSTCRCDGHGRLSSPSTAPLVQFSQLRAAVGWLALRRHRHGRHVALARADVAREVGRRTFRGCARSSSRGDVGAGRRGPLHRRLPSLQGRPRADRATSRAPRRASTACAFRSWRARCIWVPGPLRGHRRESDFYGGAHALRLRASRRSGKPACGRGVVRRDVSTAWTSATLGSGVGVGRASALAGALSGTRSSSGRSAASSIGRGDGDLTVDAARRRRRAGRARFRRRCSTARGRARRGRGVRSTTTRGSSATCPSAASCTSRLDPEWITLAPSSMATRRHVRRRSRAAPRTASARRSRST